MSQYPPDPNQPPPPQDPGQWGAPPPQAPQPPPDPYGAPPPGGPPPGGPPPGAPPDPYGAPPDPYGAPAGAPPGAPGWAQGPPSGPGWGQGTPPPMGPPAKKGANPAIIILIVVALVAVGAGAFFLLSGDDSGDSPEGIVEELVSAAGDRDCAGAIDTFSNASIEQSGIPRDQLVSQCETAAQDPEASGLFAEGVELVSTNVTDESDDSATVEATIRAGGEETTETYNVVKEDGEWRIDFGSFGGGSAQPDDGGTTPPDGSGGDSTETTPSTEGGSDSGDSGDSGSGSDGGSASGVPPEVLAQADNPEEAALAESCAAGDMAACDTLWGRTPSGSTIEAFAESCGGRDPGGQHIATCEADFG